MTADGVVRGWARYVGNSLLEGEMYRVRTDINEVALSSWRPILLVPDDGTQVVVVREEWERREQMAKAVENLAAAISYRAGLGAGEWEGVVPDAIRVIEQTERRILRNANLEFAAVLGTNGGQP